MTSRLPAGALAVAKVRGQCDVSNVGRLRPGEKTSECSSTIDATINNPFSSQTADRISWAARAVAYACFVLVAAPLLYHLLRGSDAYLGFFEDDYFYYAAVADNLVRFGKLTYDGVTPTNGFHPLWQIILTLLRFICGRFGPAYHIGLTTIFVAAMVVTYELSVRFAREMRLPRGVADVVAAMYAVGTARLMIMGMEAVIGVPLLLLLFLTAGSPDQITARRAAKLGLIASLAILARLDVTIAVGLLISGFLVFVRPRLPDAIRLLCAFGAGGLLLPTYLATNLIVFHTILPVSAMAKQLYSGLGFNFWYAHAVAFGTVYGPTVGIILPLGAIAFVLIVRQYRSVCPPIRFVGGTAISFAFAIWGLNALSGWIFFGWYSYPIVTASIAAAAFIWEKWGCAIAARQKIILSLAIITLCFPIVAAARYFSQHGPGWSISDNSLLAAGYDIAARMRDRKGVYAMGAIAGVVAYVIDHPVVQLEGIMADRRMVDHVKNESSLEDVLREYNVDYLIVSLAAARISKEGECYEITQPHTEWAGRRTAKMRGEICSPPIEQFLTPAGTHPWSVFPEIETIIWNVRDARWKKRHNN
jgi:hypothetical protein